MGCPKQTSASGLTNCHGNVFGFSGIWRPHSLQRALAVLKTLCFCCLAFAGLSAAGCGQAAEPKEREAKPVPIDAGKDPSAQFVAGFLSDLVEQKWDQAYARLSSSAQAKFTSEGLKARFRKGAAGGLPSEAAIDWTQSKAVPPPDSQFTAREQFGIDTEDPVTSWTRWVRLRVRARTESDSGVEFDVLALVVAQEGQTRVGYVRFEFARSTDN